MADKGSYHFVNSRFLLFPSRECQKVLKRVILLIFMFCMFKAFSYSMSSTRRFTRSQLQNLNQLDSFALGASATPISSSTTTKRNTRKRKADVTESISASPPRKRRKVDITEDGNQQNKNRKITIEYEIQFVDYIFSLSDWMES